MSKISWLLGRRVATAGAVCAVALFTLVGVAAAHVTVNLRTRNKAASPRYLSGYRTSGTPRPRPSWRPISPPTTRSHLCQPGQSPAGPRLFKR
jgi:hypothetical protein